MKILIWALTIFFAFSFPVRGEDIDVIYQNNLFNEDRSFQAPESENAKSTGKNKIKQSDVERKINLLGIIIIGKVKKAIVRCSPSLINTRIRGKNILTVEVGDRINNFLIKEIGERSLTLAQGGEVYTISLSKTPVKPLPEERLPRKPISAGSRRFPRKTREVQKFFQGIKGTKKN